MVEITDGDYRAYINNENILIQHTQYEKILCIEKESLNISECDSEAIRNLKKSQTYKPHAILGIIQIENLNLIIFVKSAYFIGKIEEAEIFRVKETEIIPLVHFNKIDNISSDIKSQVVGIKNLLTLGFFYSFNYDLTNSTQKQAKLKSMDIFSTANKKFFWNYCLYKKFFVPNNNINNNQTIKSLSDNNLSGANINHSDLNNVNTPNLQILPGPTNNRNSNSAHKTRSSKDLYSFNDTESLNIKNIKNINDPLDSSNYFLNNSNKMRSTNNNSNNFFRNDDTNIMNISNNSNNLFGNFNNFLVTKGNFNNNNINNYNNTNNNENTNQLNSDFNNLSLSTANKTQNYNNTNNVNNNNPFNPKVNKIWMVVCIYGHVGISTNKLNHNKLHFYLISRRSVYHTGTRYLTRGLDDYGHVANFLETEQIIRYENNLFSFLQFRGSVPIFFEQPGVTAQTQITRSPELTAPAFKKHIDELKEDFNFVYMVNLMNVNKPNEHVITQNFENQIKINEVKNCKYLFWDFQNQCKYDNYENLDNFVANLESVFKIFKYYHENTSSGQKLREQTGIIRTNCLDCLDRTNVIQARIAWKVLENQLILLKIKNVSEIFSGGFINANNTKKHPLMESFKDIWSENGDSISFQYAGTASCITSVTKNGKHGFFGLFQHGLVSITRFYQGNFEDGFKQKCIDTLLQKNNKRKKDDPYNDFFNHNSHISSNYLQAPSLQNSNLPSNISNTNLNHLNSNVNLNNQNNPTNYFNPASSSSTNLNQTDQQNQESNSTNTNNFKGSELSVFVGSWNVAGKEFSENFSLIQWLFPKENMQLPDLYVIGFQEICNLNAKNIMIASNTHKVDNWKNILNYNLNQLGKYALVKCLDLVGLFVLVYIKEELCEYIKNIETATVRTGLYGTLGNKGSCLIRFNFDDISFVFCCSHLKAGSSHVNSRTSEISEILNKNFALKNYKELKFKEHDVQFIFGDLNFRIDLDLTNCIEFIKSGYLETLFLYDQLYTKKSINLELMELEELPVKFPPTYKYLINSNEYDLKDKRVPSWCDRIVYNRNGKIKGFEYNHVEMFRESDHKPIYGIYKVKIKQDSKVNLNVNVKLSNVASPNFKVNVNVGNGNTSGAKNLNSLCNNNNFKNSSNNFDNNFSGGNVNNNNMPFAPGNNVYYTMNGYFNNQLFNNAVQNQYVNNNNVYHQNINSNFDNNMNIVNNFNPLLQQNPYMNNNNNNNLINNPNLNQIMQPKNLNSSNNTSSNNKDVFEGIFDQYKINPSNNNNLNAPNNLQNINSTSSNFQNNLNFFNNNKSSDNNFNKENTNQIQENYQINNNNRFHNTDSSDYLNFHNKEKKKIIDNNNNLEKFIDENAFPTNITNDFFHNFQKGKKSDVKTNLLVSDKKEEKVFNNLNNNFNYPVFGDDFAVENNGTIDMNSNKKNSNDNNLNFNKNIRK